MCVCVLWQRATLFVVRWLRRYYISSNQQISDKISFSFDDLMFLVVGQRNLLIIMLWYIVWWRRCKLQGYTSSWAINAHNRQQCFEAFGVPAAASDKFDENSFLCEHQMDRNEIYRIACGAFNWWLIDCIPFVVSPHMPTVWHFLIVIMIIFFSVDRSILRSSSPHHHTSSYVDTLNVFNGNMLKGQIVKNVQ